MLIAHLVNKIEIPYGTSTVTVKSNHFFLSVIKNLHAELIVYTNLDQF